MIKDGSLCRWPRRGGAVGLRRYSMQSLSPSWVNRCPFVHLLFVSLPLSSFAISFSPSFFLTHPSSTLCVYISPAVSSMGCLSSFSLALASIDAYQKFNNCSPHGRENMKKAIPVDKTWWSALYDAFKWRKHDKVSSRGPFQERKRDKWPSIGCFKNGENIIKSHLGCPSSRENKQKKLRKSNEVPSKVALKLRWHDAVLQCYLISPAHYKQAKKKEGITNVTTKEHTDQPNLNQE